MKTRMVRQFGVGLCVGVLLILAVGRPALAANGWTTTANGSVQTWTIATTWNMGG